MCCSNCGRLLKALTEKGCPRASSPDGRPLSFCSVSCFQIHSEQKQEFNFGQKNGEGTTRDTGLQVCLEECSNKAQAEFIFFLHLLRSISDCDIVKLILSRENLLQRLQTLQTQQNKKQLADLVFSTDIMKLALNITMTPERTSQVVSRIWEIAGEARDKLHCLEEDMGIDEQIDSVDREIFQAIAKTTIDNILDLGTDKLLRLFSPKLEITQMKTEGQSSSSKEPMMNELSNKEKHEFKGLYFLDLEEDPFQHFYFVLRDNGNVNRRFKVLAEPSEISEITFQSIADCICREDLKPGIDFIFLKKMIQPAIDGEDEPGERFSVVNFHDSLISKLNEEIYIANSVKPGIVYNPMQHLILHLNFSSDFFVKTSNYFFYIQSPFEMAKVQETVSRLITKEYLIESAKARLKLDMKGVVERLNALRDLCVSHMADHKVISIEITPADILFETEDEESIYSQEELDYFKTCEQEVRSERFLMNLALKASLELRVLKLKIKGMLSDPVLFHYEESKANRLRVFRCLRASRILTRSTMKHTFHDLSFVFAGQYGIHEKLMGLHSKHFPPSQVLEYEKMPENGKWLQKFLNSDTLPKILCMRYNMGTRGQNLVQLFLKPEIVLNPKSRFELKAVLQTEFDSRGVCSCVSIKTDSITNFSTFGPLSSKFLSGKPPKSLTLLFELHTQWLLLESSSS